MKCFINDFWKYWKTRSGDISPSFKVPGFNMVCHLLSDVDPNFIEKFVRRLDLLGFNSLLVTPNSQRVTEVMQTLSYRNRLSYDERTRACKKLVDFRGTVNELSSQVLDCLRISKASCYIIFFLYCVRQFFHNGPRANDFATKMQLNPDKTKSNSFADIQTRMNADNACNSSGLKWMKDVVLAKRNDHSFRLVVVGDPDLELSEIGIPFQIAESLQVPEHVNMQNKEKLFYYFDLLLLVKGHIMVCRKGSPVPLHKKEHLKIGDIFYRPLDDGDIVLINRPPSIHQHSLIALSVRVLPISSVVSINPLCCSPLCGDFDGDCLHGYIPQSVDATVELKELVALDKQLINGQSGRNLLSLSQDSLTASYLLMEDGVLLSTYQIQQLQMLSPHNLTLPAIEKSSSSETSYWSGEQLFSMLLPSNSVNDWLCDFNYNIVQRILHHFLGKSLHFLYGVQKALCEWLSMIGFSVSLSDMYLSSNSHGRKNMVEEISWALKEAEEACNFKQLLTDYNCDFLSGVCEDGEIDMTVGADHLNYERQVSSALSQASVHAFRRIFRDIQSLVYNHACKSNTLLCMFKAGSKGNLLKLVQHAMCLGLQHSLVRLSYKIPYQLSCDGWNSQTCDSNQMLPVCPESVQSYVPYAVIESSFLTGLNPLECFVHSLTNRDSSFSGNAYLPGTLTRRLMFFMRDLYNAYDGTVRNLYGNQLIQFSYDPDEDSSSDSFYQECTIGGEPVGALSACAISEAAYSALDQPISLLETSPLLSLKSVLECGTKKSGNQTMSLYLSEKLGKYIYGFEYATLEVKDYLERMLFSDIVSTVMITFTPRSNSQAQYSPWICHFHLHKEIVKRRKLKLHSIVNTLYRQCDSVRKERKVSMPSLKISCK
ncbi:putative DNA-directed RNA polymerase [Lupinus albus]|uniref:DNA-directed RNA polymerase n=1 Tax=Lupinus albus TaxID=3870 RepID=A0A6A4QJ23_LUPAL|nr:putative DNA-directed RNA polymerase [Lupinus albus]